MGSEMCIRDRVSSAINEINQMNTMIATGANEQRDVTNEISRNVSNILDSSNSAADSASVAAKGAQALHQISTNLRTISDHFLVGSKQ